MSVSIFLWYSPLCLPMFSHLLLIRVPVIRLSAHPNPGWPHRNYLHLQRLFPRRVTLCGFESTWTFGGHFQPSIVSFSSVLRFLFGSSLYLLFYPPDIFNFSFIPRIFVIAYGIIFVITVLKSLSDNSNILWSVGICWLSCLVRVEIFLVLGMVSYFHLNWTFQKLCYETLGLL